MGSTGHELAFLYISDNPAKWEMEKLMLEQKNPLAVVVNVKDMTAGIKQIRYQMLNGGPLMVGEEWVNIPVSVSMQSGDKETDWQLWRIQEISQM